MKRTLTLLLSLLMIFSLAIPAFAAGGFTDVADNAWYADAVSFVQSRGLMAGTGNSHFSPNAPTTRAMLVTILYRSAGSPAVSGSANFTDVRQDYYTDAVNWAAANDVVSGYGNGRFGVTNNVTRQDVATILWRQEGRPAASSQDFTDEASIASYAATAVDWARANGMISGKGGNRFDPRGNATRAEIATMIKNYIEYRESAEPTPPTPPTPSDSKTLVVYFSATGSTERVAGYIAEATKADTFELIPTNPYTSADLNWTTPGSRVNREHEDESLRNVPLVQSTVLNWNDYDTVFAELAAKYGKSAAQAALRFLIQSNVVVIPKSTHKDRMEQNLDVFDFTLTAEDMDAVQKLDEGESLFFSHYAPATVRRIPIDWLHSFQKPYFHSCHTEPLEQCRINGNEAPLI